MTTALVVSRTFPADEQAVHGVYQRLGTQVAALARVVERIECLFLVAENKQFSPEEVKAHEARLRRRWSADISLTIAPAVRPDAPLTRWQHYGRGIFDFHSQPIARVLNNQGAVTAVARALQTRPNLILVHRLSAMCAVMRTVRSIDPTPLFFDLDDIEHVAFFRRLIRHPDWPTERLMLLQTPRLLLAEIQAILLTRATFVCSEPDRRYLSRFTGSRRLQVVPNSIPFPASVSAEPSEPLVLFVGTMSYEPNALAADMLVKEVWPTVRARVPEARLVIAGTRPELATSYPPKDPSISFAGFVDNLGELYSRARVVCCPITYGAGTRVKIIEAAAHARAIVSTPLGAEGLTLADGSEIVLRESPDLLAQECVRLLQDEVAARQLGLAAREKARCTYDREAVLAQLERLFAAGLGERRSSTVSGSAAQRA